MKEPSFVSEGDFVTTLLQDEFFSNHDDRIADECMTFMFASTATTANLVCNLILGFIFSKDSRDRVRKELDENALKNKDLSSEEQLNYDSLDNFPYCTMCLNENLRLYGPGPISFVFKMTQDVKVGNITLRKDDPF